MNRKFGSLFSLLVTLALTGCGGGGGGSHRAAGAGAVALYFDSAAGSATGPVGTVHQIAVYQSDGTQVDTETVNLSSGTKQINLTGLPSGVLRLHIGLSTATGGAEVGAIDTTFDSAAGTPISVAMAQPVSSVSLTSQSSSVAVGAKAKLCAAAQTVDSRYVYTATNGWNWTSDNTASATVDGTGVATGVAPGSPTITAKQTASGLSANTSLGVFSNGIYQGKWTVMVYMDAANSLFSDAVDNVNQMEAIANNPNVRFVIQWKQVKDLEGNTNPLFNGTRRYLATYDPTSVTVVNNPIKSTVVQDLGKGVDMGIPSTLTNFVLWTKSKYPADHYALVLWSHARGWYSPKAVRKGGVSARSIALDDETGSELSLPDIRTALFGQHLDILAYDACLMQGTEGLAEFADKADYIVGSEEDTPEPGFPYHLAFKPFVDTPDTPVSTLAAGIASSFIGYYQNYSGVDWPLNMSVLDTSKATDFEAALDGFALALLNNGSDLATLAKSVRSDSTLIEPGLGYSYYDLQQIVDQAIATTGSASVKTAGNALLTSMGGLVIANDQTSLGTKLHGVSIEFSPSGTFSAYSGVYAKLLLSANTHWDDFLSSSTANP